MRRLLPLTVFLVVAGCGGSSKPAAPQIKRAPQLTHRQLVSAANKVCIDSDHAVFQLGTASLGDPSYWDKAILVARTGIAKMGALSPPDADRAQFRLMLRQATSEADALDAIRHAVRSKSYAVANRNLRKATADDTKVKLTAEKLGLSFCRQLLTNWPA